MVVMAGRQPVGERAAGGGHVRKQHWTERQDMGPPARMAAALAFDATRTRYVLFGGAGAPPAGSTDFPSLGDTWETFDPAAPSPVS
jgi:hypothetical protein